MLLKSKIRSSNDQHQRKNTGGWWFSSYSYSGQSLVLVPLLYIRFHSLPLWCLSSALGALFSFISFFFFWSYAVPSSKQCYLPVSAFILWEWDTMQTDLDMWTYKYAHLCVCKYTQRKRRGRKSRRRGANNTRVGIRNSQTWLAFLTLGFVSLRFLLYLISGKCLNVWIPSRTAA